MNFLLSVRMPDDERQFMTFEIDTERFRECQAALSRAINTTPHYESPALSELGDLVDQIIGFVQEKVDGA